MEDSAMDLGYNVLFPDDDDFSYWTERYQNLGENATWEDLQMSLCGVWPTASYTDMVPSSHAECRTFQVRTI